MDDDTAISKEKPAPKELEGEKTKDLRSLLPEKFLRELDSLPHPEEKLERSISYMEELLSEKGAHNFRRFWETRKLCLDFFKANIHPTLRVHLWARYSDLCREARRLKEIFDEQSLFLSEQIEKAIEALEEEMKGLDERLAVAVPLEQLKLCRTIQPNIQEYQRLQNELNFLNAFALRTTALRKELMKAEVRLKAKNRMFLRLGSLGDVIYPRRKQRIQEVSQLFLKDVDRFIQTTFVGELRMSELFDVREEIKQLQNVAKVLTLSTDAFQRSRMQLSESWDSIKEVVKERKKAQSEQRALFRRHRDELLHELEGIRKSLDDGATSLESAERSAHHLISKMHALSLSHQDVKILREKLQELNAYFLQKEEAKKEEKRAEEGEIDAKRSIFLKKVQEVVEQEKAGSEEEIHSFLQEGKSLHLSKREMRELEALLAKAKEKLAEERRRTFFALSDEEKQQYEILKSEYEALLARRGEIKEQLDSWKKASGASGHDFSEALRYTELIEEEKERLEKLDKELCEMEEKLEELFHEETLSEHEPET